MRPFVVTAVLLLVVLMFMTDSAAGTENRPFYKGKKLQLPEPCPEMGWYQLSSSLCFRALNTTATFETSQESCRREGGHLLSFRTLKEYKSVMRFLVQNRLVGYDFWIGAKGQNGVFCWIDGSGSFAIDGCGDQSGNWEQSGDCVVMNSLLLEPWSNISCSEKRFFLCQKKA
ncbi:C-type lectin lectoxin-Lio2-like [Xiphias gladius]|uniref:C-type lectin lectoxin-Lio2-like n=1 Tax=Xiphias gladius TaxID=8245 RepID=UPI001A997E25|nr:C-type lectin lectoxin-Lio2-like [Xiphias gladius]XP_039987624.1 C-type lectin lectoxin-Lio2-like [Xiphias gladius]XP_039987635.1 C-type lectin lectoxin-Lio2-like [Xiphias gladius]XP_039987644.1 C-type lectin lectoxin-Lio2-like [Xiphias gladius]XP_039987651.1 C-type lectin lectoxin-Lio2-like [Xiphias gladius]XP_039987659.1 C-type lectin lectoxin-Lio2-like [Xiphias gladius]XP_039987666.1 C-type lectin lectoxin-Lio2-like [Xiphias gladius]XP_039987676.1 C-type lectin lectoxin-Lio2-like [Xiph